MPDAYLPEPLPPHEEAEALKYGRLVMRLDPHLRGILLALLRRLADDAIKHPRP